MEVDDKLKLLRAHNLRTFPVRRPVCSDWVMSSSRSGAARAAVDFLPSISHPLHVHVDAFLPVHVSIIKIPTCRKFLCIVANQAAKTMLRTIERQMYHRVHVYR